MEVLNLGGANSPDIQFESGINQLFLKLEQATEELKRADEEKRYLNAEIELAKSDDIFEVPKIKGCVIEVETPKNRRLAKEALKVDSNHLAIVSNPI